MTVGDLLSRLERVRPRGPGRWSARCPAHADKTPSLSVRELEDGRVLLHCFSGCAVDSVAGALGLDVVDLFPPRLGAGGGAAPLPKRGLLTSGQALEILKFESLVIAAIACDMVKGAAISQADHERLLKASGRVQAIAWEATL